MTFPVRGLTGNAEDRVRGPRAEVGPEPRRRAERGARQARSGDLHLLFGALLAGGRPALVVNMKINTARRRASAAAVLAPFAGRVALGHWWVLPATSSPPGGTLGSADQQSPARGWGPRAAGCGGEDVIPSSQDTSRDGVGEAHRVTHARPRRAARLPAWGVATRREAVPTQGGRQSRTGRKREERREGM